MNTHAIVMTQTLPSGHVYTEHTAPMSLDDALGFLTDLTARYRGLGQPYSRTDATHLVLYSSDLIAGGCTFAISPAPEAILTGDDAAYLVEHCSTPDCENPADEGPGELCAACRINADYDAHGCRQEQDIWGNRSGCSWRRVEQEDKRIQNEPCAEYDALNLVGTPVARCWRPRDLNRWRCVEHRLAGPPVGSGDTREEALCSLQQQQQNIVAYQRMDDADRRQQMHAFARAGR